MKKVILIVVFLAAAALTVGLLLSDRNSVLRQKTALEARVTSVEEELRASLANAEEANKKAADLEAQNSAAQIRITEGESAALLTQTVLAENEAVIDEQKTLIAELTAKNDSLQLKADSQTAQIEELTAEAADWASQLEEMRAQGESRLSDAALLKTENQSLQGELAAKVQIIQRLSTELSSLKTENSAAIAQVMQETDGWAVTMERLQVQLAQASQNLLQAQAMIDEKSVQIETMKEAAQEAEEKIAVLKSDAASQAEQILKLTEKAGSKE